MRFSIVTFSVSICSKKTFAAVLPISRGDWSTELIVNSMNWVKGSLLNPTTQKSCGMRRPISLRYCMAPNAPRSLAENSAFGGLASFMIFLMATFPASILLSSSNIYSSLKSMLLSNNARLYPSNLFLYISKERSTVKWAILVHP